MAREIAASIVVPSYRSRDTIAPVLRALASQETSIPYEIIVVESSGDGTGRIVRDQFPEVSLIESDKRLYPGAARNRGAETASGELLLFVDSDCTAERAWLSTMWRTHQEWDCAAVAGSILNANPGTPISISSYMNEFSDFFPYGKARYVDYLPSGNLSYKMDVFRRHGGFDPNEPMYEDLIFNKILGRAGEKLLFNPAARVAHRHRCNLVDYLKHEIGRGRAAAVCRRKGLLIGTSWTRYPMLALAAVPGLYLRKSTIFPYRLLRAYPSELHTVLLSLPCFHLALCVWHYGFLSEILAGRSRRPSVEEVAECTTN